jgi:hypothetical protein
MLEKDGVRRRHSTASIHEKCRTPSLSSKSSHLLQEKGTGRLLSGQAAVGTELNLDSPVRAAGFTTDLQQLELHSNRETGSPGLVLRVTRFLRTTHTEY